MEILIIISVSEDSIYVYKFLIYYIYFFDGGGNFAI